MQAQANNLTAQIKRLNDAFRRDLFNPALGEVVMTPGVAMLAPAQQIMLLEEVQAFEDFNRGNDPYGEHDFGSINIFGGKYFWKIDYYNKERTGGSEASHDADATHRVLTVMHASEY